MIARPLFLSAVSLLFLARGVLAQNGTEASMQSQWQEYDCFDPTAPSLVRRGQSTTVCLYVGPGGDWNDATNYKRFSVNLVADEFSSYNVPGCKWTAHKYNTADRTSASPGALGW